MNTSRAASSPPWLSRQDRRRASTSLVRAYEKYGEPRPYRYLFSEVFPKDGNVYLSAADETHSILIDVRTQGAAFDAEDHLWLSQSGSNGDVVQRLDAETGDLLDLFAVAAGLEDLSFDRASMLCSVSEGGSLRWNVEET